MFNLFIHLVSLLLFINKKIQNTNKKIPLIVSVSFNEAMTNLQNLEKYISEYKTEKSSSKTLNFLILSFIRQGKYNDETWTLVAGAVPNDLYSYIESKDAQYNTKALECRTYGDILFPNNKSIDFVHLFATMNGIDNMPSSSALVGWGGDLAQLAEDLKKGFNNINDLDTLIKEAKNYLGKKGQFGQGDLNADLDAPIILNKKKSKTFADTIKDFYAAGNYKTKVRDFMKYSFPDFDFNDKSNIRQFILDKYSADVYIKILECKYGLRNPGGFFKCYVPNDLIPQYINHRLAAVYAFADYLADNL